MSLLQSVAPPLYRAHAAVQTAPIALLERAAGRLERRSEVRRNDVVHIIFIIAIVVLLILAASLVAAAIVLCAQHGGVLDFVVKLDPWTVKVGCRKL
jgi:hypothetical protein